MSSLENLSLSSESNDEPVLRIFPIGQNKFLAKIEVDEALLKEHSTEVECETIVILDRSGSMGNWVEKVCQKLLPKLFTKLGYNSNDSITIIAFDNNATTDTFKIIELKDCDLSARGGTFMKPAIDALAKELSRIYIEGKAVRILAISDGDICDKKETEKAAHTLTMSFKEKLRINSQAIQLFTSDYANPDTVALCSLLQLNNSKSAQVANIFKKMSQDEQVNEMFDLMKNDNLGKSLVLESVDTKIFKKDLWEAKFTNKIYLKKGENIVWLDSDQAEALMNGSIKLKLSEKDGLVKISSVTKTSELNEVVEVLQDHLNHVYEYLKVLKFIDSDDSKQVMNTIVQDFRELESQLKISEELPITEILAKNDISSRIVYLRQQIIKRRAGFSMKMAHIANNDAINQLNSAQKAEYLRSTDHSKTSRGLAKRAAASGLNFDEIARQEVLDIAENLEALLQSGVDDSQHQCSFYSMETTLGGLKALAALVKEPGFDDITVNDILLLLNIVGIACEGTVGDYPDPMTWRVNRIYPGVFLSVSDILTAKLQCGNPDSKLAIPGHENAIATNVIPVFEDRRIAKFMREYAPNLLSYSCSIGMRGMIAHINMTDGYTICAGIWKLIETIVSDPTELNLKTFGHLCQSYHLFAGNYFKSSFDCLLDSPSDQNLSFYLQNNGLTNMISPIYHHCLHNENSKKLAINAPAITRALFSYEIWQVFRRLFKGSDFEEKIEQLMTNLLRIDLEKNSVKLPPLFEKTLSANEIKFHDEAEFDFDFLLKIVGKNGWYLKYVLVIIKVLKHAADGTLSQLKTPPTLESCLEDEDFIKQQLGISYSFKEYLMYSAIQSLMYPKMTDRVDQRSGCMHITDLVDPTLIKDRIKAYIANQFKRKYDSDLVARKKIEKAELLKKYLNEMTRLSERSDLVYLFINGVVTGEQTYSFQGLNNYGYIEIKEAILDVSKPFLLRKEALKFFLLACDPDNDFAPLFNGGNAALVDKIEEFEKVFIETCNGTQEEWNFIYEEYKERSIHTYRLYGPNRHGHHNDKPSYWAMGYPTLEVFAAKTSKETFEEYCKIHFNCCGVNLLQEESDSNDESN